MKYLIAYLIFISCAFSKPIELVFWHSMAGDLGQQVTLLVDDFNQSQQEYVIKAVYKGEYTELLTSFAAAFRAHQAPDMIQVYEVGTTTMLKPAGIIKPVAILMQEQQLHLETDHFFPAVLETYSLHHQLQALPFNISLPVLYYNKTLLDKNNIIPVTNPTWDELEQMLYQLREKGQRCGYTTAYPAWIQIEAFAAIHGLKKSGQRLANNHPAIIKHLTRLRRWQSEHLFEYGGRNNDATLLFTSGRCAFFSQSSGSLRGLQEIAPFSVGVMPLPFDATIGQKRYANVVGGAALWAITGQVPNHYRGIAQFFQFIITPERQSEWHLHTGYLPVSQKYLHTKDSFFKLAHLEFHRLRLEGNDKYSGPENQIRLVNDEALERIFAGIALPEEAMSKAEQQAQYLIYRFHRILADT